MDFLRRTIPAPDFRRRLFVACYQWRNCGVSFTDHFEKMFVLLPDESRLLHSLLYPHCSPDQLRKFSVPCIIKSAAHSSSHYMSSGRHYGQTLRANVTSKPYE